MSIADTAIMNIVNNSDIGRIFIAFCAKVFEQREIVIKNKELSAKSSEPIPSTAATSEFRSTHKILEQVIKTTLDNEKFSSLPTGTETKDVIYAMSAIADEVFLNIEWIGKPLWEENMLEMHFFGSQIAGEEIFNKINELLKKNDRSLVKKAEIYLKMLSLGFKGKYRGIDDERIVIDTYCNRLFDFITKNDHDASIAFGEYRLFQKEYTYTIPSLHRKLLPDGSIITCVSAFFIFMFLTISSLIWIFETRDLRRLLFEISSVALRE